MNSQKELALMQVVEFSNYKTPKLKERPKSHYQTRSRNKMTGTNMSEKKTVRTGRPVSGRSEVNMAQFSARHLKLIPTQPQSKENSDNLFVPGNNNDSRRIVK